MEPDPQRRGQSFNRLNGWADAPGLEAQNKCAEIKLRAERKAGEVLAGFERTPGVRTDLTSLPKDTRFQEAVRSIEISRKRASSWQQAASVPEAEFEAQIAKTKEAGEELTSASVRYA